MKRVLLPLWVVASVLAIVLHLANGLAQTKQVPPFKIIVHPSNPVTEATRRFVADTFLKKVTRWPNGDSIQPVDQTAESQVRQRFSEDVLNRSVGAVKSYWQQVIFSGRGVPPPELASDDEVVQFVLKHEGGVGYVSGGADIGTAHVLAVQ